LKGQAASSSIKDPSNGNGTSKASGKEGQQPISIDPLKKASLAEVARLIRNGEIDLYQASCQLRESGFSHREINDPSVVAMLQKAATN
jgi:hypothetical protein